MIRLAVLDMAGTTVEEGGAVYVALDGAVSAVLGAPSPPDVLEVLGWTIPDTIDGLVTAEQVGAGRPSPLMIHEAMARTGIDDPAEVAVAGDTLNDRQAGANAGAEIVIGVLTGSQDEATLLAGPSTHVLPSAARLPELLASLAAR